MSSRSRTSILTLAGAMLAAPAVLFAQDVPEERAAREVPRLVREGIQPGDRITLTIYNQQGEELDDLSGERTVDARGFIYLPFLEDVEVQGLGPEELRDLLGERYEQLYANSVVETRVEYRVSVTGSVRSPGNYFLAPTATLLDALSQAGGSSSEIDIGVQGGAADPSRVQLTRRGYERPITINFRPFEADSAVINARIQSGDWLFVPPARRSQLREDILFFGNILTVLLGSVSLIILIG